MTRHSTPRPITSQVCAPSISSQTRTQPVSYTHLDVYKRQLLEYAVVYNDYKGIPKQQIRDALSSGRDVILRVDVQGAATVRRLIPNAISVFLTTRSEQGLVRRLRQRKQDTAEGMALRTATARQEMKRAVEFDYCVVNPEGEPETAVQQVLSIIDAAHCRINQEPVRL